MSRYAIDKVMREMAHDEAAQAAFLADTPGYLGGPRPDRRGARGVPERRLRRPVSPGRASLPAVGVHPRGAAGRRAAAPRVRRDDPPHGTPDFAT